MMFLLPEVPENYKLEMAIVNGRSVIKSNPPAGRVFDLIGSAAVGPMEELLRSQTGIPKKQIAKELDMDITFVREIVWILSMNGLVSLNSPRWGWVELSYDELLRRNG